MLPDLLQALQVSPYTTPDGAAVVSIHAALAEEGLQHASIKGYLSAVRRLQIVEGLGVASWPLLESALKGIKRKQSRNAATRPDSWLPITPAILRTLRWFWEREPHNPDSIMLWEACCTCFFGFLRSGEITVPSLREYLFPGMRLT